MQELDEIEPAEQTLCLLEQVQGQDEWTQTKSFEPIEKSKLTGAGAGQLTTLAMSASRSCTATRL